MTTNPIEWTRKRRPRKADDGHSVVRNGRMWDARRMVERTYIECQCGGTYSGWGWDGAHASHSKHVKRVTSS